MIVILIQTTELLGFLGALQLSADKAELRTVVRLNAQATVGPELPLAAEPVKPTRNRRNMTPSSASASRKSVEAVQPRTFGPIKTPARICPMIPG
jgi:hypothetical protein